MCGLNGVVSLSGAPIEGLSAYLEVQSRIQAHRGPDDRGTWISDDRRVGLGLQRLSIFDLSRQGRQPMGSPAGTQIVFNGEIYNWPELRRDLYADYPYRSTSDTEVLLAAFEKEGPRCLDRLRGMFAFAIWDADGLFAARDRFGIKPFHYAIVGDLLFFASEAKALMPFIPQIETEPSAFAEYLVFQCTLGDQTLFKGIKQLPPGYALEVRNGQVRTWRYWDVHYEVDLDHSARFFQERLRELVDESIALHLRSDVPVGSYVSGGVDSSLVALLAQRASTGTLNGFHGRFTDYPGYDESVHARHVTDAGDIDLRITDITADDFRQHIAKVIYHLDYPVAGPGAFPQFMVSSLASDHVKVVLGGQGGDEIFGGYARYLLAYFEQCIKAAIQGTHRDGNFVVTAESIIPNLGVLLEYMPLIKSFWSHGLFEDDLDARYYRLIDRSVDMQDEIEWRDLDMARVYDAFMAIFNSSRNVRKEAYFDSMTHFDFKVLLPALLHVEDRMSMAHGLEARVPLLDHPLVEFAATVPADVKFEHGKMKHLLKETFKDVLPTTTLNRRDKMGFPVPLSEWAQKDLCDFFQDVFRSEGARSRPFINSERVAERLEGSLPSGRKLWALLSLELWQQEFHDRVTHYRSLLDDARKFHSDERIPS